MSLKSYFESLLSEKGVHKCTLIQDKATAPSKRRHSRRRTRSSSESEPPKCPLRQKSSETTLCNRYSSRRRTRARDNYELQDFFAEVCPDSSPAKPVRKSFTTRDSWSSTPRSGLLQ